MGNTDGLCRGGSCIRCVRLVLSFAATLCRGRRRRLCCLHLPKGEEDEHGVVWQLTKALCGTRRAALLFQEYVIQARVKIGFTVVRVAAQTFHHAASLVLAIVHGDDFIASGETQSWDMLDQALEQFFVLKKMPRNEPLEFGGSSEGQLTKRTVSWSVDGFQWKEGWQLAW